MESRYMESYQKALEMDAQAHIPNSAAVGAGGIENGLQEVARVVDYFWVTSPVLTAAGRTAEEQLGWPHRVFLMFIYN